MKNKYLLLSLLTALMFGCAKSHNDYNNYQDLDMLSVLSSLKTSSTKKGTVSIFDISQQRSYQIPEQFGDIINKADIHKDYELKDGWLQMSGKKIQEQSKYILIFRVEGCPVELSHRFFYHQSENRLYYFYHDEYAQMNEDFRKIMISLKEQK
jgi:hypothetical protein